MTDTDQQALLDRVIALEEQLREARSGIPSPGAGGEHYERAPEGGIRLVGATWATMPAPARSETVAVRELIGNDGCPSDARSVRQLVAAVAIARHEPVPGARIPRVYGPIIRQLAAARAKGMTWRQALTEVALDPPSEAAIAECARVLRQEVAPLYDLLLPVAALLKRRGAAVAAGDALARVGQLM